MTPETVPILSPPRPPITSKKITVNKNQQRQKDDLDPEEFLNSFFENHPEVEQLEEEDE